MQITFKTTKLRKSFDDDRKMDATYGTLQAKRIRLRMAELAAAVTLGDFWPPYETPGRYHELTGNRKGQLSADLDHPYRLIFEPDHDPIPKRPGGGLDWFQVNSVKIIEVEDTHG